MKALFSLCLIAVFVFTFTGCSERLSSSSKVGDTVKLGGMEWVVLAVKDDAALILSKSVLTKIVEFDVQVIAHGEVKPTQKNSTFAPDMRAFQLSDSTATWETSDIRKYLNDAFYNATFSDSEKKRIIQTTLVNDAHPTLNGGANTMDRVFLLSVTEWIEYVGNDKSQAVRDAMASVRDWWLRTPWPALGGYMTPATTCGVAYMLKCGSGIGEYGAPVNSEQGIRPAMWVKLK